MTGTLTCIIDDDASVRASLLNLMRSAGVCALAFESAESFLGSDSQARAGCIITDIQMPGMSGIDLRIALAADHISTPVIMITARMDESIRARALAAGAFHFFRKPFETEALLHEVAKALRFFGAHGLTRLSRFKKPLPQKCP